MTRFARILVCLDRADQAEPVFDCVRNIARLSESTEVILGCVAPEPAPVTAGPTPPAQVDFDFTPTRCTNLAEERMPDVAPGVIHTEVILGEPLIKTLKLAHDRDVDLIVIDRRFGRTGDAEDEALMAERITRKAHCSVLVLAHACELSADRILVPVRDSECSANALEIACEIAAATSARVVALNVYHVGAAGYARVGTTFDEHARLVGDAAQRETQSLLERVPGCEARIETCCVADHEGKPATVILKAIQQQGAKLVVIGARGRTGAAGVLLGNVTEKLIHDCPVPVLAVKKKGECLGVLRALLTLATEG